MSLIYIQENQIFFKISNTCIYLSLIVIYWYVTNKLVFIQTYKIIFTLLILVIIELTKYYFTSGKLNSLFLEELELNILIKFHQNFTKIAKETFKFYLLVIGITSIYYITIVLFGAPLLTQFEETLALALTLTTLTLTPTCLHLGTDNAITLFTGSQLAIQGEFINAIKLNIKTVLLGTWFSAFVLPLDWDQPWQVWPTPCIIGALFGSFIGHFINFITIIRKFEEKCKKNKVIKVC